MSAPKRAWPAWAATGAVAGASVAAYLVDYARHHYSPVGWDIFGYIWQTKAVGHAALSAVGTRPGVPVLAAILGSVLPLDPLRELVALPPVLAAALGLAAGAAVRMAFRLSAWWVPVIAGVVAMWPGTARIMVGYEANLLLLVLLAAGAAILVQAEGRVPALAVASGLFVAAALTHIVIFAAFVGVVGLFVLASIPGFVRDRRSGLPLLATDAGAATVTVLGSGAVGAAALFGLLGLRPSQAVNTSAVSFLFQGRTVDEIRRVRPPATIPIGLLGAAVAWRSRWSRAGRALSRLALAWLALAGAGVLLSLRGRQIPGARFLLFALPVPVLAGLGVGAVGWTIARVRGPVRALLAAFVVLLMTAGLATSGLLFVRYQLPPLKGTISGQLNEANAYLAGLPATPVVFVVDQPGPHGAFTPKLRLNVVRTGIPADRVTDTFVYVGTPQNLLAGRPTLLPITRPWQRTYDDASRAAWEQVRPALARGAVVLIAKSYNEAGFTWAIQRDPSRQVSPGLYVLRGPARPLGAVAPPVRLKGPVAALSGAWLLIVLMVVGWGYAGVGLRGTGASTLDRLCLAPATGAAAGLLGAFVAAAAGADPRGPLGIAVLVLLAAGGFAIERAAARRPVTERPGDADPVLEPTGRR